MINLNGEWGVLAQPFMESKDFLNLEHLLEKEYENYCIFPKKEDIFNAFNIVDYNDVKVVILGQDPYHEKNQAMGLSFSVPQTQKIPPSLKNIFKEIESSLNVKCFQNGDLTRWANQGVLLLNTVLTVREGQANSHKNLGWNKFTDYIIELLNKRQESVIFVLWGNNAKVYEKLITNKNHYILFAPHPSPLSAYHGFFGCNHFVEINKILASLNKEQIDFR